MPSVKATIPTRIDIAGGTIDLWPIHCVLDVPATVNIGVTLDAEVVVSTSNDGRFHFASSDQDLAESGTFDHLTESKTLPLLGLLLNTIWNPELPPISIKTSAKSPAGAGLGGSSCLGIAIAAALFKMRSKFGKPDVASEKDLVQTVQDAEARLIHAPTGCQDYWGGLRGNINVLRYPYGNTVVTTKSATTIKGINESLTICYSGKSRKSAINNWEIFKRVFDRDQALIAQLNQIAALSNSCANAILNGDLASAVSHSKAEWEVRKNLWPNIETSETSAIDQAARKAGASFSRVCGAGGGGVMAIFSDPAHRKSVEDAATKAGGTILDAVISQQGLRITEGP
jgi:D-glycero-alpha-D-manno-heptose-7-phosphate kinase